MTLRLRLVLTVLGLLAAGMCGAALATFGVVRHELTARVDGQLSTIGRQVESALAGRDTGAVDEGQIARAMTGMGFAQPSFIQIRDASGTVLKSVYFGQTPDLPAGLAPVSRTVANPDGETYLTVDAGVRHAAWRVRVSTLDSGSLVVGTWRADQDGIVKDLAVAETAVTLTCLAVLAVVAVPTVRRAMRPLRDIAGTAHAIGHGDLARRVPQTGTRSEVGQVAQALNTMLERIQAGSRQREVSQERLREFVADAAHELRTPVTTIRGYAELFRRGAGTHPDDLATAMHRIESEARRIGVLVDELVLLARLDENRPADLEPVDLVALAREAVTDAHAVEPDRPLRTDVPDGPVVVLGDRPRLHQIAANLLANVRQHTPAGTPVTVTVRADGDRAVLEVADEGPGMGERDAARAFERFYRADPSRSTGHGGSGLGLAIVSAIAAAHGGSAALHSREGSGTTVTVRLAVGSIRERGAATVC
jgi:two-component system OmpR family sensor kinase